MSQNALPKGQTRISHAVVVTVAMTVAREVRGVIDIVRLTKGAAVVGGVVGMAGGGMGGAALGASAGGAAGAATAHQLAREQKRRSFHEMNQKIPNLRVYLTVVYGRDLVQIAQDLRARIRESIRDNTGLEAPEIEVIFTEVVSPRKPSTRKPSQTDH